MNLGYLSQIYNIFHVKFTYLFHKEDLQPRDCLILLSLTLTHMVRNLQHITV